ncbi:VOC family protein [Nocardioides albus]|uniref:Glycosyltransferase n=1 Tax=Nocardioides albus TaxID=1841 RepID=A0A7W5A3W3_9ACTN|nr:VOC family protein [Nocardioides albus]MBB3088940.1 hypothetical protein [Nocardioides albus]GGU15370.1 hypothetical protein GCM10007979_12510 [Nocardioides albus]
MSDYYDAFEVSPVPLPGPDAVAPEPFRGIYGMPQFLTVPCADLAVSTDFWVRGLGFIDLFNVPGQVVHLRRWTFQDVLLVPAGPDFTEPTTPSATSVSFSCVLNQIEQVAESCRAIAPDSVVGPRDTYWNTRDIEVITPERTRVIFTAAKQYEATSQGARNLDAMGIPAPSES